MTILEAARTIPEAKVMEEVILRRANIGSSQVKLGAIPVAMEKLIRGPTRMEEKLLVKRERWRHELGCSSSSSSS